MTTVQVLTRALLICLATATIGTAHAAEVMVVSGDVIQLEAREWRIANIDAPQIGSSCVGEAKLGVLAQAKLAEIVAQGEMEIRPTGERDMHLRAMALVRINGEDVGEKMIAAGLAQRHGQAKPLCYPRQKPWPSGLAQHTMLPPPAPPPPPMTGWIR